MQCSIVVQWQKLPLWVAVLGFKSRLVSIPIWCRWLAYLPFTQDTRVRVPVSEEILLLLFPSGFIGGRPRFPPHIFPLPFRILICYHRWWGLNLRPWVYWGMCPPHCSQMTQPTTQAAPTTDSFPAHRELAIEHTNVIIFRYNFLSVRVGIAISTTTETRTEKRRNWQDSNLRGIQWNTTKYTPGGV